jgi:macrodomain Ter protein organizer (MatP/YcbG family)
LAEIVAVWHELPEHIKQAIRALVQAHILTEKQEEQKRS